MHPSNVSFLRHYKIAVESLGQWISFAKVFQFEIRSTKGPSSGSSHDQESETLHHWESPPYQWDRILLHSVAVFERFDLKQPVDDPDTKVINTTPIQEGNSKKKGRKLQSSIQSHFLVHRDVLSSRGKNKQVGKQTKKKYHWQQTERFKNDSCHEEKDGNAQHRNEQTPEIIIFSFPDAWPSLWIVPSPHSGLVILFSTEKQQQKSKERKMKKKGEN